MGYSIDQETGKPIIKDQGTHSTHLFTADPYTADEVLEAVQLTLPFMAPVTAVRYPKQATIQERFEMFHALNPHVYDALVSTTRNLIRQFELKKLSIKLPYEMVRWTRHLVTSGAEKNHLPNEFTSRYALEIMKRESDLNGVFDTKKLRSP